MSWVAAAVIGGAVIGAVATNRAAGNAASAQSDAAAQSNETQKYMYDQTRIDQTPWREAGVNALGQINSQMSDLNRTFKADDFTKDPGYDFRMAEGQKAIERSAAARGGLNSGATMKSLARYSQGVASDEYQNAYNRFNNDRTLRFNRLSSLAGVGQTANNQIANSGQNYANQVSNNQTAVGNANAAANMAGANAFNGVLGTGMNTWMQMQMMNRYGSAPGGNTPTVPSSSWPGTEMAPYQSSNYGTIGGR